MGNTSLFDEEDEQNMSMDLSFNNRFSGLYQSPINKEKGTIVKGLTEAVIEVDEEEEPKI